MSLLKNKEAKLNLILQIEEEADYIEFDDNPNFEIIPCRIDIKGEKGEFKPSDTITIKCKAEFKTDETLIVKAYKEVAGATKEEVLAGKIKVWANDASKQKQKKVVFVQIETPELIPTKGNRKASANSEQKRIGNYLNQAFISLHADSKIVDMDLSTDKDFLKFVKGKSIDYTNTKDSGQLHDFLKNKLNVDFKGKYDTFFKAFYFAESGGATGGLSGYSQSGKEYVVVFKSANDQTAAHEFLHSMNLAHSFTNSEASANAEFTYEYTKTDNLLDYSHHLKGHENDRCSLWYWQWARANDSIT